MKAIAVLRVSTDTQEIEGQKRELVAFAKEHGYGDRDLIYVEAVGASAIKMDQKYMDMAERIKELILEGGVDCVFVWEISRLGRNEVVLMKFKEMFIQYHIQFICKNPSLKLLDDDWKVNSGTELAFSLFATMAKQEMIEKKERFKRKKITMARKGMYIGGHTVKFGYRVDDGYFVEDEEEGKVVKAVFDLYSTGMYSTYTLAKELSERGMEISDNKVSKILRSPAYVGDETSESGMNYPAIISRELFDRCLEIRQKNKIDMKRGEKIVLGAKLVKCPVCGATCTSNSRHYVCSRHVHHGPCSNGFALRQEVAHDLLWRVAYENHLQYLMDNSEDKKEAYRKSIADLDEKIVAGQEKIAETASKKDRIVEAYIDGLIDRKNRDLRLSKIEDDVRDQRDRLTSLQAKRRAIAGMLEDREKDSIEAWLEAIAKMDQEDMFQVIHQHCEKLVARQVSFGKRDPRTKRDNAVEIVVTSIAGGEYKFMYIPKYYQGHNLYIWNGKWVPDRVTTIENQI